MTLYNICEEAREQGVSNRTVTGITDDTREVKAGYVFVAINGEAFDGHTKAAEMLEKGAVAVITEQRLGLAGEINVPDTRAYFARLASAFYGNPTRRLKLIAATGTNGKSTTVSIIKHILNSCGHKCGSLGTVEYDVCGKTYEAHLTTPRQMDLFRYFSEMVANGAEYCVMEASSLALVQRRISGERFVCSVFTNLTQDHLDYHKTMESYFDAKKMLFPMSERAIICIDDDYGLRLTKELEIPFSTYSIKSQADWYTAKIECSNSGLSCWINSRELEKSYRVTFPMPGSFNAANALAAVAVCAELGLPLEGCIDVLQGCKGVRGRSEVIYNDDSITVICDYAHTEDALVKILTTIKSFARGRIICVFGAAGERDAVKRKPMGEAVASLTDYAVITSDNPRFEDAETIISQVAEGFKGSKTPHLLITDRKAAIEAALSEAKKGDIVALCGKGHETYQVIGDDYRHFDEREIVAEIMNNVRR